MSQKKQKQIKVTLVKSTAKKTPQQKACVKGLGLTKIHQTVTLQDDPCIRGMINKVHFLLKIEE